MSMPIKLSQTKRKVDCPTWFWVPVLGKVPFTHKHFTHSQKAIKK